MKAKILLVSRSRFVILPEKNRGTNTKRFFTHCSTRSSLKYFFIYLVSNAKIRISNYPDKNTKITANSGYLRKYLYVN
jgi:hypothetical protein